ncbi:MAG TPA: hypothetical protein VMR66_00995 [Gemmatimonadota bacterium]|nr:hypothetical protein [Gemmatimonadota bacterium]
MSTSSTTLARGRPGREYTAPRGNRSKRGGRGVAGRIYGGTTNEAHEKFRRALDRERRYDDDALVSLPAGSRYQPERAEIWERQPLG